MPIEVSIPQIGDVSFPDDMSMDDINNTIRTKILPQYVEQKKTDISQAQSQAEQLMKYGGFQKFIEPLEKPFVSLPTAPDVEQTGLVGPEKLLKYNLMSLSGAVSPETQAGVARGAYNIGKQFSEFVASPIGVATVGASTIPALRPAIAAIFGAQMLKDFPEVYENTVNVLANPESTTQQKTEALLGYLSQGTLGVKLGAKGASGLTKQLVNAAENIPEGALKATIRAKVSRPLPSKRQLATLPPAGAQQALPPAMAPLGGTAQQATRPTGPVSPIFSPTPTPVPAPTPSVQVPLTTPIEQARVVGAEVPAEPTALTPVRIAEIGVDRAASEAEAQGLFKSAQAAKPPVTSPQETPAESAALQASGVQAEQPTQTVPGGVQPPGTTAITPTTTLGEVSQQPKLGVQDAIQESRPGEIPVPESERTQVYTKTGEGVLRDSGLETTGAQAPKTVAEQPAPAQPQQPTAPTVAPVTPVPVQQQPIAATPAAPAPTPAPATAPVQPQPAPFTPGALKTPQSKRIGIVPGQPLPQIDGLLTRVGDLFKKYFTAKGLKSAAFFDLEKRMQYERTMYGRQVERLNADFKAALRKAYGISRAREAAGAFRLIPESDVQLMYDYLEGNVSRAAAIPVEVRGVLDNMRAVVDGLSTEMANMLRAKAASLPANQVSQRTQLLQLADKILQGRNHYLHRSYAFFDSNLNALDWFQQMPAPIRQVAENYIQANTGTGAPLTLLQAQTKLLDWLEELKPFFGSKGPGTSKLGSKDMSVLMKRGVIAPELRALLGEYRDPLINFTETVAKLSQNVASQKFLNDVRDLGIRDGWLYPEGQQPPGFNVKIAGAESDSMNPLNGMRTSPQIAEIFAEYMKQSQTSWLPIRLYLSANAWTKQAVTTLSPMAQMRNLTGQPFFFGMSGHWSLDALGTALRGMREEVLRSGNQNVRAYLDDAARYGIFGDTARSAELDAILKDADFQTVAPEKLSDWSTGRMLKRGVNTANKFYRVSDEFGKLVGWEVEKRNVSAVNPTWTPEQVKTEAAKRISNFYPTGSMVPEAIKQLRKLPFGPFMTFAFEAVRTSANAIAQSVKELRSSNPIERSIGKKRLVSQMLTLSASTAISGATAYLFGVSRQEQDDFRKFQPDYAKNSQYAWMPSKPGERNTINLSYINPYQYTDVVGSVIRGLRSDKPVVDVIANAAAESFRPFYSESMLTTVIADYMRNKDRYGNEIYNEQDTLDSQAQKVVRHFAMPFMPGPVQRAVKRIIPAFYKEQPPYGRKLEPVREIAREVTGISMDGFDYRVGLGNGARTYTKDSNDSESIFRQPILRSKPLTENEMFDYYVKSDQARQRNWTLLREQYLAALRRGVQIAASIQALKDNGIGEKEAGSIVSGVYEPYKITDDLYEKALERGKKIPLLRIEDYRKQQIGVRK